MDETVSTIIANARRLLDDANKLAAAGSFRTAISLAVLSFEESGKACLVYWQEAGFISDARERLKHHIEKQRVFLAYRSVVAASKFGKLSPAGPLSDYKDFKSNSALSQASSEEHKAQVLVDLIAININMNDYLKESGFYVDIDSDLNAVPSHTTFDRKQFEPQAQRAEDALRMASSPHDTQRFMATIYAADVRPNLSSKQRREQQQRFLTVMNAHFENGLSRSNG
jgi:AbiV family abortive infection protein